MDDYSQANLYPFVERRHPWTSFIESKLEMYWAHVCSSLKAMGYIFKAESSRLGSMQTLVKASRLDHYLSGAFEQEELDLPDFVYHSRLLDRIHRAGCGRIHDALPRAMFIGLFSLFDAFVGGFLRLVLSERPKVFAAMNHHIAAKELDRHGSLDELNAAVIAKEIESLLRESYERQLERLSNWLGVKPPLTACGAFPAFWEGAQARNLFTHTDGIVSDQYLSECAKWGIDTEGLQPGNRIEMDGAERMRAAYDAMSRLTLNVAHRLWQTIEPCEAALVASSMNQIVYRLLCSQRWRIAGELGEEALQVIQKDRSGLEPVLRVNTAIGFKFANCEQKVKEVLANPFPDGVEFRLARAVLEGEYEEAGLLMREAGSSHGVLTMKAYHTWPLLHFFRPTPKFLSAYKSIFGDDFVRPRRKRPTTREDT